MSDTLIADVPLQPADPREWKSPAQELRAVEAAQRGLPRGYKLPAAARPILTAAAKTDLRRSTVTAFGDTALFIGTGVAAAVAHAILPATGAWAISLVAIVVMGRSGRALECMVHEASHRNWQRQGRWNDLLSNVLAGFPTASQVGEYRASHMIHHARLGSDDDPDIIRYEQFDLESMTGLSGGHHSLHHLWSSVPHHQIAKMHQTHADLDRDNFAANIQRRKKVPENVCTGLDA